MPEANGPLTDEVDVRALAERLRAEIASYGTPPPGSDGSRARRAQARDLAERAWPVTAERPIPGGPAGLVKKTLRKLMRWYVEPLAYEQRLFNDATLKLLDELSEEVDRQGAMRGELERVERLARELEERLVRVERRGPAAPGSAPAAVTVAAQPAAAALPDYFAFESRMRGRTDEIRERQRPYVELLRRHGPVVDLGCGRGELLSLLAAAKIEARGVDADADMVAFARGEGLDVEQADAVAFLEGLPDGSLGAVFSAQLVEHLPPPALLRMLELAHAKLRPGGVLVAETINPLSPLALRNYFADLTHAQPLVPETLELLARGAGFAEVEIRLLNEPAERLVEVELEDAAAGDALRTNVARLNELLFGPLDYAVVATR